MPADLEPDGLTEFTLVLAQLTPRRRALLLRMAEALTAPAVIERHESDLVDDAFSETLANSLLLHHAIHDEPLNKGVLRVCDEGLRRGWGHFAELNLGRGTGTWDIRVDDQRWSLKTEAARGISPRTVKIEKLMEARWVRECSNPARCAAAVRAQVPAHMGGYDRILVLRAFRLEGGAMRYDLVEPPKEILLARLSTVPPTVFTKEGAKKSYGADIDDDHGRRVFRILLDSSVEKIRVGRYGGYPYIREVSGIAVDGSGARAWLANLGVGGADDTEPIVGFEAIARAAGAGKKIHDRPSTIGFRYPARGQCHGGHDTASDRQFRRGSPAWGARQLCWG